MVHVQLSELPYWVEKTNEYISQGTSPYLDSWVTPDVLWQCQSLRHIQLSSGG